MEKLIDESIKSLIFALSDFKDKDSNPYLIYEGKIGYKDQDGISTNISFGYQTLWAYFLECENGKISKEIKNEKIGIEINCGKFSYAEIARSDQFDFIFGVTGTLKELSLYEKNIIKEIYKIEKETFIPPVFGKNKENLLKMRMFTWR